MKKINATKQEFVDLINGLFQVQELKGKKFSLLVSKNLNILQKSLKDVQEAGTASPEFLELAQKVNQIANSQVEDSQEQIDNLEKENKELVEFYTSLGQIKRNNKALHFSKDTKFNLKDTNDNNVLIIERSLENQTILFISNLSDESKEISHDINGYYRNLISGEITNFNSIEKLNFKSWDYLLLEKL